MTVTEGQLLWEPGREFAAKSNINRYIRWLKANGVVECSGYHELWQWSVDCTEAYWASLWDYFGIISDTPYEKVTDNLEMKPGNRWFIGSRVNWAEHILRHEKAGKAAIYSLSETRPLAALSWTELASKVRILAARMRSMGVTPGDAVCCLMPNIPETVIAMLATISIGAVWSNAAPEFGRKTILDRFSQIKPKWLFVADGYQFAGKAFDRREETVAIVKALADSLQQVIFLPYLDEGNTIETPGVTTWQELLTGEDPGRDNFRFERVPHDHPLWVLFSSGTTGLPKAIVHSHIGALMGMTVQSLFHLDLKADDISFFYTTTGWMVFNMVIGMMLAESSIVLYDGNPAYPQPDVLWKMAADTRATGFGASPTYVQLMEKLGVRPGERYDLDQLRWIACSGSPAAPETFEWFYKNVKRDLWVSSQSGGTEIVGGFVCASPTLPVYAGEIQCLGLGMAVEAWNDRGEPVIDEVGELVCTKPFPSMPLYFLNDEDNLRYREAYFDEFPGVWRHGDFIKINQRGGAYIYGRSDATLNRYGVRIGTAELYRTVENLPEVTDSLVVCVELPNGEHFMPMFLQLAPDMALDEHLQKKITAELRSNCSPRHIPDGFYVIDEVPYTLTGKKLEVPVRKLLLGWPIEKAVSKDSMRNPKSIEYFVKFAASNGSDGVPGS